MSNSSWNDNRTVKRWVLFAAILIAAVLLFLVCAGPGHDAHAATPAVQQDPQAAATSFTETAVPYGRSGQCWEFGPWRWENDDALGNLRFGWGHDLIACTNSAATKWTSVPTFDIWHWLGYWQFKSQSKSRSQLGYSWLDSTSYWAFKFDAVGVPLVTKERTLKCRYYASSHSADCTLYE